MLGTVGVRAVSWVRKEWEWNAFGGGGDQETQASPDPSWKVEVCVCPSHSAPCVLSSEMLTWSGWWPVLEMEMFVVGGPVCPFLWKSLVPGLEQTLQMLQWVSSTSSSWGWESKDCEPTPQARLFPTPVVEIENHLARAAAFAKVGGKLRYPEQDVFGFTLVHFYFFLIEVYWSDNG